MTVVTAPSRGSPRLGWLPWRARTRRVAVDVPPLSPRMQLVRGALVAVFAISVSLLLELLVLSSLQQRAAQQRAYDSLRADLAEGTAPIGPTDVEGKVL